MPTKCIKCSICHARICGYNFKSRMKKLRKHYKNKHPIKFRSWYKKK